MSRDLHRAAVAPWTSPGELAPLAGAVLVLSSLALVNGFPIVFEDTGFFLTTAAIFDIPWNRPMFYGAFLGVTYRALGIWGVVAIQSALTVAILALFLRVAAGRGARVTFAASVALALFTSLPWFTGMLMPDVFQAPLVMACYLLAFHWRELGRAARVFCLALVAGAILVHYANFMLVVGLAALLLLWRAIDRTRPVPLAPIALMAGIGALAIALQMTVNYVGYGRPSLSEGAPAYALSRLVDTGLAKRYLDAHCHEQSYVLCAYRDRPARYVGWYIFDFESPFRTVWNRGLAHTDWAVGARRSEAESLAIIRGTLGEFPFATLWQMLVGTAQQLVAIKTAEGVWPNLGREWIEAPIHKYFPEIYPAYAGTLQNRGLLPLPSVRALHVLVASASLLLLTLTAVRGGLRGHWLGGWTLFLAAAFLQNAVISGTLAGPASRYGSRLAWLFALAALLVLVERRAFLAAEWRYFLHPRAKTQGVSS